MIQLLNRIEINRPVSKVYRYLRKMENIPDWNYYVRNVIPINLTGPHHEVYKQFRENDKQTFRVKDAEICKKLEIETLPGSRLQFKRRFLFAEVDNSTCILYDKFDIDTGYPNILQHLFKRKMQSAVAENLNELKNLLENGASELQN